MKRVFRDRGLAKRRPPSIGQAPITAGMLAIVALFVLTLGCGAPAGGSAPTFAPPATAAVAAAATYTVGYDRIVEHIEARGRVAARQEALLTFPLDGTLKAVHVSPGDHLEAGAVLAELDAPDVKRQALDRQHDLTSAKLSLDKAELTAWSQEVLAEAKLVVPREQYKNDHDDDGGLLAPEQARWEIAQTSAYLLTATHQLDVAIARAKLEWAQQRYQLVAEELANMVLKAPFAGTVVSIEKRPGDQVEAHETVGVFADPTELWVVAPVLAVDVEQLTIGQPATVRLDAFPDQEYTGKVLQVASQAAVWQGKSAYDVTIVFDEGQDVPAIMRMGADVAIAGPVRENVLLIPQRAVITIGGQSYVEVVDAGGEVARVPVQTGISNGTETEILIGLKAGHVIRVP